MGGATATPYSDATNQDALYSTAVDVGEDFKGKNGKHSNNHLNGF